MKYIDVCFTQLKKIAMLVLEKYFSKIFLLIFSDFMRRISMVIPAFARSMLNTAFLYFQVLNTKCQT